MAQAGGIARPKTRAARYRWMLAAAVVAVIALAGAVIGLHTVDTSAAGPGGSPSRASVSVGAAAPNGTFTTLTGTTSTIASLRGRPTLVWFVSTWCTSCQYGTQVMARNIGALRASGVRVEEVELYQNMGQNGTPIGSFAKQLAGAAVTNPDWSFGVSSAALTRTYDPKSYLDIYYLLNTHGKITYVNSSPGSTMAQLLRAASTLG